MVCFLDPLSLVMRILLYYVVNCNSFSFSKFISIASLFNSFRQDILNFYDAFVVFIQRLSIVFCLCLKQLKFKTKDGLAIASAQIKKDKRIECKQNTMQG